MQNLPNMQFFYNKDATVLDVLLHGGSEGMDSALIQKLITKGRKAGHSVVAFNFPFLDRGEDHSSGPELKEEQEALKEVLTFVQANQYQSIHLLAKSLGGIVGSYFLKNLPTTERNGYSITVLGYVKGDVDLKTFNGKIHVIQGQMDKFGNIEAVKEDLASANSQDITYTEIAEADHSYRDPQTKEYKYEDIAIEKVEL